MSSHEVSWRSAVAADAGAVTALVRSAYRGDESRAGWTTEADILADERIDEPRVLAKIEEPDGTVLLAFTPDGALIGCCELLARGDGVVYFGMFAVSPALQAAGVGRRMLAEAERVARERWDATVMEMTVIGLRTELIDWYVRRGYVRTDETRPFPYDELINGEARRDDLYFSVLTKQLADSA
jgi:GNAT superfamily N-acetyltransferase